MEMVFKRLPIIVGACLILLFLSLSSSIAGDKPGYWGKRLKYKSKASKSKQVVTEEQNTYSITVVGDDDIPGVPIPASPFAGNLDDTNDTDDVYSIYLNQQERLNVSVTGDPGTDIDLWLFPPGSTSIFWDMPVDGAMGTAYPDSFSYVVPPGKSGTYYLDTHIFLGSGNCTVTYSTSTVTQPPRGDFGADFLADAGVFYNYGVPKTGLWAFYSTGTSFNHKKRWMHYAWNWYKSKPVRGDFNGDGLTDIAVLYDYGHPKSGLWVFTSTGGSFTVKKVLSFSAFSWYNSKLTSGDFNGDGLTDIAVLYDYGHPNSGLFVFYSTGPSFNVVLEYMSTWWGMSFSWYNSKLTSGDFNGDGKEDVGVLYKYGKSKSALWLFTFASWGLDFVSPWKAWQSSSFAWNRSMLAP
jgi:hypothetical protein